MNLQQIAGAARTVRGRRAMKSEPEGSGGRLVCRSEGGKAFTRAPWGRASALWSREPAHIRSNPVRPCSDSICTSQRLSEMRSSLRKGATSLRLPTVIDVTESSETVLRRERKHAARSHSHERVGKVSWSECACAGCVCSCVYAAMPLRISLSSLPLLLPWRVNALLLRMLQSSAHARPRSSVLRARRCIRRPYQRGADPHTLERESSASTG
jgi:hypothetical protein